MTFDAAIATDFGTMLADLRDKVTGMVNWNLLDTSAGGGAASVAQGEWFVLSTPFGEDIRVHFREGIVVEYGPDWDDVNDTWADRYPNDIPSRTPGPLDNTPMHLKPRTSTGSVSDTTLVTYWLEYVNSGFALYCQREEADGDDGDLLVGFEEVTQLWDYDAAASRESNMIQFWGGYAEEDAGNESTNTGDYNAHMAESNSTPWEEAWGEVNPDANFANYPYTEGIARSSSYRNAGNVDAIIGTYDMVLRNRSGGDTGHRDTIDDAGVDVYTVLERNQVNCAIRMD